MIEEYKDKVTSFFTIKFMKEQVLSGQFPDDTIIAIGTGSGSVEGQEGEALRIQKIQVIETKNGETLMLLYPKRQGSDT